MVAGSGPSGRLVLLLLLTRMSAHFGASPAGLIPFPVYLKVLFTSDPHILCLTLWANIQEQAKPSTVNNVACLEVSIPKLFAALS